MTLCLFLGFYYGELKNLVLIKAGIVTLVRNDTRKAKIKNGMRLVYGST